MSIRTDLAGRLIDGRKLARKEHVEGEVAKLGNLRAGNSGMMSATGDFAGACPRVAHLRQLGIEVDPPDDSKVIMFQLGTANEDVVYADLLKTKAEDEVILREEEIPIEWFTSNGTRVTGRPDMVVCHVPPAMDGKRIPIFGVEIKSIASVWTTRDVLGEQQPKLPHLIQAGHYAAKLGIPFRLLYKQYAIQEIPGWKGGGGSPGWSQKLFPKKGEPGSESIDYEKGRIQPFELVYEIEFDSSSEKRLRYRRESPNGAGEWTRTLVTLGDIERFYEHVSKMSETGDLGRRPLTIDALGKEKNYSNCSYCPLLETCDKTEKQGYTKWLEAVRLFIPK